jgi:hypothetical protein
MNNKYGISALDAGVERFMRDSERLGYHAGALGVGVDRLVTSERLLSPDPLGASIDRIARAERMFSPDPLGIDRFAHESDRLFALEKQLTRLRDIDSGAAHADALARRDAIPSLHTLAEPTWVRTMREFERSRAHWKDLMAPSALDRALKTAEAIEGLKLHSALEQFRTDTDTLAHRLALVQGASWWQDTHASAFAGASALSDALWGGRAVNHALHASANAFLVERIPTLPSLIEHRAFLDAAGLLLPRLPRRRRLTRAEKERRFNERLREDAEPQHIKKAKSLTHSYELALRDAIHAVMTDAYGEEWWLERLPLCCPQLLSKWRKRGGDVLECADFAHYIKIMTHPEHHAAGFDEGFPDLEALAQLLEAARQLRGDSHHASRHRFTPKDLRTLHVTWGQIRVGLIALQPDEEFDWHRF